MDGKTMDTGGKVVSALGDSSGAIGIICGLLLLGMLFFFKYLMDSARAREAEILAMNKQLQKALVANATAMTALSQVLQRRACMNCEVEMFDKIRDATGTSHSTKEE
jgi:hypothetical protein